MKPILDNTSSPYLNGLLFWTAKIRRLHTYSWHFFVFFVLIERTCFTLGENGKWIKFTLIYLTGTLYLYPFCVAFLGSSLSRLFDSVSAFPLHLISKVNAVRLGDGWRRTFSSIRVSWLSFIKVTNQLHFYFSRRANKQVGNRARNYSVCMIIFCRKTPVPIKMEL